MNALDELKSKIKTSYIEECIIWALKTDAYKTAAISELNSLRSERDALKVAAKKLLNEMPESEIELIREVWGNTNTRILLERRSELAAALAGN